MMMTPRCFSKMQHSSKCSTHQSSGTLLIASLSFDASNRARELPCYNCLLFLKVLQCCRMDVAPSVFLSLRGFSSESFGKTLTDGEIDRKLRKGAFKNRSCPIFYVKSCSQQWGAAQRGMMQWFADLSSDIHFCRLWQACSEGELDGPIANSLQNLLITLDQELTLLERRYEQRFAGDGHSVRCTDFSVLMLYQKFRTYSPLFTSILRMVETAVSDRNFRRKLRRAKKPASHAYFGMIGIQSEFDLLQRKSYLAVDESGNLIQPAQFVRYGQLAFNKRQLSLRMHFRNPQVPLFSLFLKNVYSSWLQFTLSSAFFCTTKRNAGEMKEDNHHILEGVGKHRHICHSASSSSYG